MMSDHRNRDDFSRFLVHLTRDYEGSSAQENLISILRKRRVEARNAHCLFAPKIKDIGFSKVLKRQFNTVCLTEIPLNQLRFLAQEIPKRKIELKPFGIVFWKTHLLDEGANPAIYVNSKAAGLRELLLKQFDHHFEEMRLYRDFKKVYGEDADAIIRYYALINIISERVDFSWEREWRLKGDLSFNFDRLVAIIAHDPKAFRRKINKKFGRKLQREIKSVPVISPEWNYEQLVEEMTFRIWEIRG
jgi:hypothetical protein